jgi:hypothetical protein
MFLSSVATFDESDPYEAMPHVTTVPSLFSAANACCEAKTFTTPDVSNEATEEVELSSDLPQQTTLPSDFKAAKARSAGKILTTPLVSCEATALESPP